MEKIKNLQKPPRLLEGERYSNIARRYRTGVLSALFTILLARKIAFVSTELDEY